MNHYTMADMTPGLTEEFTVTVTAEMMDAFCTLTGDVSPIHMDEDYAKGRGYPGRVVYGMLGASFFSTLAGVYLPGFVGPYMDGIFHRDRHAAGCEVVVFLCTDSGVVNLGASM